LIDVPATVTVDETAVTPTAVDPVPAITTLD
jgi:hypothetical protein